MPIASHTPSRDNRTSLSTVAGSGARRCSRSTTNSTTPLSARNAAAGTGRPRYWRITLSSAKPAMPTGILAFVSNYYITVVVRADDDISIDSVATANYYICVVAWRHDLDGIGSPDRRGRRATAAAHRARGRHVSAGRERRRQLRVATGDRP